MKTFEELWAELNEKAETRPEGSGTVRALDLKSASHIYDKPGRYVIAAKVIDIFGNDTMSLTPISVG